VEAAAIGADRFDVEVGREVRKAVMAYQNNFSSWVDSIKREGVVSETALTSKHGRDPQRHRRDRCPSGVSEHRRKFGQDVP
jgi:hypothetical protein